jgi:DNA-binding NtrC family response regulator
LIKPQVRASKSSSRSGIHRYNKRSDKIPADRRIPNLPDSHVNSGRTRANSPSAAEVLSTQRILVVEDMEDARTSMQELLKLSLKIEVDATNDGAQALKLLGERPYSVVITDLRMPKLSGLQLIEEIQKRRLPATIVVTTGHGSIADAVQAMRQGAYDFLTKPVDPQHLCLLIERALRERSLQDQVVALRQQLDERYSFHNVLSKSTRMVEVFDLISQVAETQTTVLIVGETGTGKEMIAQAIHEASGSKRSGPLVAVNCAALPETLLESELFGHEKGAFTGASGQRKGRFEQANGGTLFLDEVGDVPMSMQIKLLRVLQERRIERVGSADPIDIDVRLIAATNRPLETMVEQGKFREDLFYRLNVVRIDLPPLRDRLEDIPLLAAHFARKYARPNEKPPTIHPESMEQLLACPWPGNIRQLENAVEYACVTTRDGEIRPVNLPADVARRALGSAALPIDLARPLPDQLTDLTAAYEERYLRAAMAKTRGHVGKCAEMSGLSRRSITDKLGQYSIDKSEFKSNGDDDED